MKPICKVSRSEVFAVVDDADVLGRQKIRVIKWGFQGFFWKYYILIYGCYLSEAGAATICPGILFNKTILMIFVFCDTCSDVGSTCLAWLPTCPVEHVNINNEQNVSLCCPSTLTHKNRTTLQMLHSMMSTSGGHDILVAKCEHLLFKIPSSKFPASHFHKVGLVKNFSIHNKSS